MANRFKSSICSRMPWCIFVTIELFLVLSATQTLFSQQTFVEKPKFLVGFTRSRNDLEQGQHANWITKRAFIVEADGTHAREVGQALITGPHQWTQFAGWSPDGKTAVLLSAFETPENAAWEKEHQTFRMTEGWKMDSVLWSLSDNHGVNVTAVDRVSNYNTLIFTADGHQLLMTSLINGVSKPYIMDLDGRNKRDISNGGNGFAYGLSSTPDGQYVAYHEDYQIYVSRSDGSDKQRIETGNSFNFSPKWSPDGSRLMFVSGEHYNCHPYVVQRDGTGLRKLADRRGYRGVVETLQYPDFHSESSDLPIWDLEGASIIYTALDQDRVELYRTYLNGRTIQLSHSKPNVRNYHPAISPDGKWLLFGSDRTGVMQLFVRSLESDDEWAITAVAPGEQAMHGHWQPSYSAFNPLVPPLITTVASSSSEYTRKSEGDSIELEDGRLLIVYMEFSGNGDDFAKTRLVAQESHDGGKSWVLHREITTTLPGDMNVYSPNLIRCRDGGILLVFMRQHNTAGRTCFAWKSTDEGKTFHPYSTFFANEEFSLCNGTLKRLSTGRLLLPASPPVQGASAATGPYEAAVLYSDDDGLNWSVSMNRVRLPLRGAMEPHIEETKPGQVLMVMRSQLGKLQFAESLDGGVSWSEPWDSDLATPESCPELTRIPGTEKLLLLWNQTYDPQFRSHFGKRSPLTAAVSKDHGKSWKVVGNIETDSKRAFSNPGCRFTRDGKAVVNYWTCEYLPDWRMQDVIDLRVAIVDPSWFESK